MIEITLRAAQVSIQGWESSILAAVQGPEEPGADLYSLVEEPCIFKGRRPIAVRFPGGGRTETASWKDVVEIVLRDCTQDPTRRKALMNLRNRVYGRTRTILGSSQEGMKSPIAVGRQLFFESNYNTEELLSILKTRILEPAGYDYSGIQVAVKRRPAETAACGTGCWTGR